MHQYTKAVADLITDNRTLTTLPKIDYRVFATRWLALFNYPEGEPAPLGEWIQAVAYNNGFMPVEVWKDGTIIPDPNPYYANLGYTSIQGGEYMFTVPAVLNSNINVKLKDGADIASRIIQADAMRNRIAAAGDRYMENNVNNLLDIETPAPEKLSSQMDEIFKHFGIQRRRSVKVSKDTDSGISMEKQQLENRSTNEDLNLDF